ncbi:uncharacterized protein LOC117640345 [Thrips palmi]|uniref:Uncharacterized protein LOC117640345 n=1 Tax=Thrips palmi TaxID=161013 RepID=A0A6P8XZT0_THRPL|nr:uncharacterized protein LOC117640345 [Thrips palmi]
MDRRHGPLRSYRSVDNWPSLGPVTTGRRPSPWLTLPLQLSASATATTSLGTASSSMRTKTQRAGRAGHARHYGHRSTGAGASRYGDSASAFDLGTFHFRQFSDDSGFSSCGSSASSVADEFETPGHLLSVSKTPIFSERPSRWSSAQVCGAQSDTVASVLAAGVSDSEETDHCESDDDFDTNFMDRMKSNRFYSPLLKTHASWPHALSKSHPPAKKEGKHTLKEKMQYNLFGRDILDLGTNLVTQFPLKATELPEKNLSLFLQNRSQYHRLGKFGTVEKLLFANCKEECGFTYPIPPGEYGERLS